MRWSASRIMETLSGTVRTFSTTETQRHGEKPSGSKILIAFLRVSVVGGLLGEIYFITCAGEALDRATGGCPLRRSQGSQVYPARCAYPAQRGAGARRQELERPAASGNPGTVRDGSVRQESGQSGEAELRSEGGGKGRARGQGGSQGGDHLLRRNPRTPQRRPED